MPSHSDSKITNQPIKVFVVDDLFWYTDAVRLILSRVDDIELVGVAKTPAHALAEIERLSPSVVLVDIDLGENEQDGIELAADIHERAPLSTIVMLTKLTDDAKVAAAIAAGAVGYIIKSETDPLDLLDKIRNIGRHGALDSSQIEAVGRALRVAQDNADPAKRFRLTDRELEILRELDAGKQNEQIAEELFLSVHTVKGHMTRILSKLKAKNRGEAVHIARINGLLD